MDLIDRYVHAVGRQLPRKDRADIQAELKSTMIDTLEARSEGEPSEEQVVALLTEFGQPDKVAASYWPNSQYLIGPKLYPLFRMSLGIAVLVFVIVQLVLLGVMVAFNQEPVQILELIGNLVGSVFTTIGVVILVFAVLQRLDVKPDLEQEEWDPRELPAIEPKNDVDRRGLVVEITIGLIIIAILLFWPDNIGFRLNPWSGIILNPVVISAIPLIILSVLIGIGIDVVLIWRGRWETSTRMAKIGANLFSLYVLGVLLTGQNAWLASQGFAGFFSAIEALPETGTPSMELVQVISAQAFRIAFIVALIIVSIETINMIYQLIKQLVSQSSTATILPPEQV
jgi:hypothetical protein